MNEEHVIQTNIRLELAKHDCSVYRINVGSGTTYDGRHFSTGVPKGFPDLFGFRHSDGKAFFIEVKTPTGKVRPEQKMFIENLQNNGALAGIARSVDDAIKIIKGEM